MNMSMIREEVSEIKAKARPLSRSWWDWNLWMKWVCQCRR
jgi:hypothetical protein